MPQLDEQLKKQIDDACRGFEEFKTTYSDALKKGLENQGEVQLKLDKISESVLNAMEAQQKAQARMDALEHMINNQRDSKGGQTDMISEIFKDFVRKSSSAQAIDFAGYVVQNKIDLKAMSTQLNPDGGYLVMPTFGGIVEGRVFETTPIRQLATVESIGKGYYEEVLDDDEAGAEWVGERQTRPKTPSPQLKKLIIQTHEITAEIPVTQTFLEDSEINVEQWLANKVANKFSRSENTAFISGDGVVKPRGIITYPAWSTPGQYQANALERVSSGAAGAFTADGLIDLQNSLKEYYQSNAVFVLKRASFKTIFKLKDGNGNYLFNRELTRNAGVPFDLLGSPVRFGDDVPAIGSGTLSLLYGDFRAGYKIIDRVGLRVLRDPYTERPFVVFATTKRTGGDVVNFEAIKIQVLS